jgi:hypothetical protein
MTVIGYTLDLSHLCFLCLEWMAHWNAVFDLAWVPGELKLVSDFHFIMSE